MRKNFRFASLLAGLVALAACTRPAVGPGSPQVAECCRSRYLVAALQQPSTTQLGREYQRLKRRKCQACSHYGSDFQKIMNELGTRLNGQPRAAVERAMGRPDVATDSTLIYYWRYTHDFLRFRLANGVATSSWYYALE